MAHDLTQSMRRDWDERARKNAFHYIASWRRDWDVDSFLRSGEEDFEKLVAPALARCGIAPTGRTMAELGCGAGRMTGSFARRYERVYAFDLSEEMLRRARQIHGHSKNILWVRSSGADLACVGSDSIDFACSYLVLQHLPHDTLVFRYIGEMLRVLRPGAGFLFQFNGGLAPTMNLRGRLVWGAVDALWSARLVKLSHLTASLLGLDPASAGKSWRGAAIPAERVADAVLSAGGELRELRGENTPMTWCCGVKRNG
jgi:ubiquinone/menaquinone biosynthesis C-methylase UbiE